MSLFARFLSAVFKINEHKTSLKGTPSLVLQNVKQLIK